VTSDSLRVVLDSVFAQPSYNWVEPPRPLAILERWWEALQRWLFQFRDANPTLFYWFLGGLVVLLVLIFVHAGWVMFQTVRAASSLTEGQAGPAPAERRDAAWFRGQADRLADAGRFVEAMQAAFFALILELDANRVVRYHPSKTPHEYAEEASLPDATKERLRRLVLELYGHVFARRPCAAIEYRAWRDLASGNWHAPAH
jgi:Domain of unknown function (DUF4129)